MCFVYDGEWQPVERVEGRSLVFMALVLFEAYDNDVTSEFALAAIAGLDDFRSISTCWDSIAAAACLRRLELDSDLCSITSDILRFFKIGFLA